MAEDERTQEALRNKVRKRRRRRFRAVVPTTLHNTDGTPALTFKTVWAPVALSPVVIWDLEGRPKLLSYAMKFAPCRGAPRCTGQSFGIWLSYHYRRLAGWGHWPAINDIARCTTLTRRPLSSHRVRNAWREGRKFFLAELTLKRLHFSALEALFASCDMLSGDAQFLDVPVPSYTDPIVLHTLAKRLLEDPAFRRRITADDYLEPPEVAKIIRRPVNWLAKARVTGEGPRFLKVGRKILYRRSTVEAWLAHSERSRTGEAA